MGVKEVNDKFYTKKGIARRCLQSLPLDIYDTIIEPSAGSGSFSSQIECKAYDLMPESGEIQQQDFFKLSLEGGGLTLVVGNPPFGIRNSLSKGFIKHAMSFYEVKTVAFILPKTWMKHTLQKTVPEGWWLRISKVLPDNSFTLNGEDYHVPCVWQVWERGSSEVDLRDVPKKEHSRFELSTTYKEDATFFILGAAPNRVIEIDDVKTTQRGYYVSTVEDSLHKEFMSKNWSAVSHSGVNGGVSWCTKSDIFKGIEEKHYV